MRIAFFSYFYPPDLSPGAFRSKALVEALSNQNNDKQIIHVITTQPNRYESFPIEVEDIITSGSAILHRIKVPQHGGRTLGQIRSFFIYLTKSFLIIKKIKPDFMFCTTGRHMTSAMTWLFSLLFNVRYYVDFRDIFSEAISDIYKRYNLTLSRALRQSFLMLEKAVLKRASGVNVVSEAFFEYYKKAGLDVSTWSFNPNGVDIGFVEIDKLAKKNSKEIIVVYAGNIGEGQGLEKIIPKVAAACKKKFKFNIIGDGSRKNQLLENIERYKVTNIEVKNLVPRDQLIEHYINSDILFLHLNTMPAFKRSLPSKIFEYAVIGKPIVAGLPGYSRDFVKKNIPHAHVFEPCDVEGCLNALQKALKTKVKDADIQQFVDNFSREKLANSLSSEILRCAQRKCI